jgi:hypothetical protein
VTIQARAAWFGDTITPPGYSITLAMMIAGSIGLFAIALEWSLKRS